MDGKCGKLEWDRNADDLNINLSISVLLHDLGHTGCDTDPTR